MGANAKLHAIDGAAKGAGDKADQADRDQAEV